MKFKLVAITLILALASIVYAQEVEKQVTKPNLNIDISFIEAIGDSGSVVKIFYNGDIEFGEGYEPDEAAKEFYNILSSVLEENEKDITSTLLRIRLLNSMIQPLVIQVRQGWLQLEKEALQ